MDAPEIGITLTSVTRKEGSGSQALSLGTSALASRRGSEVVLLAVSLGTWVFLTRKMLLKEVLKSKS